MRTSIVSLGVLVSAFVLIGASSDRASIDCLSMNQVAKQDVVDDSTILYSLNDGRIYANLLSESCPDLKTQGPRYDPQYGPGVLFGLAGVVRICSGDRVTADRGSQKNMRDDFRASVYCPLGKFFEVSQSEAGDILNPTVRQAVVGSKR